MDNKIDLTINRDFSNFNKNKDLLNNKSLKEIIFCNNKMPWSFDQNAKIFFNSSNAGNIYTGSIENIKNRKLFEQDFINHCECCGFTFSKIPWIRNEQGKYNLCNHCDTMISNKNVYWSNFKIK